MPVIDLTSAPHLSRETMQLLQCKNPDKEIAVTSFGNSDCTRMRTSKRTLLCVGLLLFGEILPAHHAPFLYDTEIERIVSGIVESFEWVQPHTWVTLRVEDTEGEVSLWRFEGMSPLYLGYRGWNRYSIRTGDIIEVAFLPRRDGTREGMFLHATLPDGSRKVMAVNQKQSP